ncbi:MAG: rhodanese-like domain-containing protein [Candidatus Bathyarchaeia archaeon]|nr:sulfurtransferase [Candidatus Bathyarchaeota archaeon]
MGSGEEFSFMKPGREIPPIVSTQWLHENLGRQNLVIVDIRSREEYLKGHIPGAINVPFDFPESAWITVRNGLLLEIPAKEALFQTIGSMGIKSDSLVIVVGKVPECTCPMGTCPFPLADAGRVAETLIYAGLKNVAILNGGHNAWADEGRPLSTDIVNPIPTVYRGTAQDSLIVTKKYVLEKVESKSSDAVIIDARDPHVYFGIAVEEFSPIPGHIKGAKNLPAPWLWENLRTYKPLEVIGEAVSSVVGEDKSREIIVYCGVGGYTFMWGFILTEALGYTNVKLYDGSYEEWANFEPRGPIVKYKWE